MQFNVSADYAVRIILYLDKKQNPAPAKDIVETTKIPDKYARKILTKLKNSDILSAVPGKKGGFQLKRNMEEIMLNEVLRAVDGTKRKKELTAFQTGSDRYGSNIRKIRNYCRGEEEKLEKESWNISIGEIIRK